MGRRSKVRKLPPEVRSYVEQLLREDRLTLDEMLDAIRARFPHVEPPSRSGLHRYKEGFEELAGRMREIDAAANALVGELGEGVGEKAGALLAQAVTTLATNAALVAQQRDDITIEEIRKLARAAKDAIDTRRISLAERQALERAAQERLLREQKARLESVAKERGMSAETVEQIRQQILGVT